MVTVMLGIVTIMSLGELITSLVWCRYLLQLRVSARHISTSLLLLLQIVGLQFLGRPPGS